jgi:hypothetical protein
MNDRYTKFRVAIRAQVDGGYRYQIFTMAAEPRSFKSDDKSYATPAEAEQAGYEAVDALMGPQQ